MPFEPIDFELEVFLKEIIDKIGDGEETQISNFDHRKKLDALVELGMINDYTTYMDGNSSVSLTHSGLSYFKERSRWVMQQSRSIVEGISESDSEELAKLVVLSSESGTGFVSSGFDTTDEEENQIIARLSQRGFLKVKYADNVPWFISITPEGYDEVKRIAQTPEAKNGKVSTWLARLAGTFTGAAAKEFGDL